MTCTCEMGIHFDVAVGRFFAHRENPLAYWEGTQSTLIATEICFGVLSQKVQLASSGVGTSLYRDKNV